MKHYDERPITKVHLILTKVKCDECGKILEKKEKITEYYSLQATCNSLEQPFDIDEQFCSDECLKKRISEIIKNKDINDISISREYL